MRPSTASLVVSCLLVLTPFAARADVPYSVIMDGRMLDAHRSSARNHDGTTYINIVRAVKAFDGLLTFGRGGLVRVTVNGRTLNYRVGRGTATLDNTMVIGLHGIPYVDHGDTYVPIASIATLAQVRYSVDTVQHRVTLTSGRSEGFATPVPKTLPEPTEDELTLSPLQALNFDASATTDNAGLHARVAITNKTNKPYSISFPGPQQFVFVIARNGSEVWTSESAAVSGGQSTFRLLPGETTTVSQDWPGYLKAGPGRYTLRVRMLKAIPIDTIPVSLGVSTPGPSAAP
jgi:hypothetical protein